MGNLISSISFSNSETNEVTKFNKVNNQKLTKKRSNLKKENGQICREIFFVLDQCINLTMIGNFSTLLFLFEQYPELYSDKFLNYLYSITFDDEEYKLSLLMISTIYGRNNICNFLISLENINHNYLEEKRLNSALHFAVLFSQVKIAATLVSNNSININERDKDGKTALMLAIIDQNIEIVDILLSRSDLDLFIVDFKKGNSFLHFACDYYNQEIFKLIIRWLRVKDKLININDDITYNSTIINKNITLNNNFNCTLLSNLVLIENYQGFTTIEILDEFIKVVYDEEDEYGINSINLAESYLNLMKSHYQNENLKLNIDNDEEKNNYL